MLRWGVSLLSLAIAAFVGLWTYNTLMQRVWYPLNAPLKVTSGLVRTPSFKSSAGQPYEIYVFVKPRVPYADCLLGYSDQSCRAHRSVIDVAWDLRDLQGRVLASGVSAGTCCEYDGADAVGTKIDGFSIPRTTATYITLKYNRAPTALAPLGPRVEIDVDSEVTEAAGLGEGLIMLLGFALGGIGLIILAFYAMSRYNGGRRLRI